MTHFLMSIFVPSLLHPVDGSGNRLSGLSGLALSRANVLPDLEDLQLA